MTTYERVFSTLSRLGIPCALQSFPAGDGKGGGAPSPPFICYLSDGSNDLCADDGLWCRIPIVRVELYEASADWDLEARVETLVNEEFGPCSVTEDWVESEHCRMVTYTFSATPEPAGREEGN